jgi:hypothetical protein
VFATGSGADQIQGFSASDGDRLDLQARPIRSARPPTATPS